MMFAESTVVLDISLNPYICMVSKTYSFFGRSPSFFKQLSKNSHPTVDQFPHILVRSFEFKPEHVRDEPSILS